MGLPQPLRRASLAVILSVQPSPMDFTAATPRPDKKKTKRQLMPQSNRAAEQRVPVPSPSREQLHRAVALASLSGKSCEDIKFFAFSRRTRAGTVDTPLPITTNTTLIRKASSHFDYVLGTGFSESNVADMEAPYPSTRPSASDCYDYMSDSDLDDEDDAEGNVARSDGESTSTTQAKSELEVIVRNDNKPDIPVSREDNRERTIVKPGRVVYLEDIAYTTWKAFAFYAYFGEVAFAPLRSQHQPRPQVQDPYKAPLCSPKSMYRVAEKYNVVELKDQALASIKSSLSPHNILEEVFSSFTSVYPAVQEMELHYLYDNVKDPEVQARLPAWLETLEEGHLPKGAASIIGGLISRFISSPQIQFVDRVKEVPATVKPGMKACPNGCTTYNYTCGCGRYF
ncbi:hypothetical protein L227DRAFT_608404 [Lentinus tigrinus ALCF2SS1-6]|uniref:BTB domain-containing protein n=1 Tax=Lentinus tigrinus ALCF2SS1-6 TaxID=1328759 RepID=A0A5C2SKQ3_9APHY|nr:hypothetical protein L227DRAFT_608404 [Lentinus tigrinus ALCF2SS1-6]